MKCVDEEDRDGYGSNDESLEENNPDSMISTIGRAKTRKEFSV